VPEEHTDDPAAALWGEYKQHHSSDARERLILHYAPLVKFVAGRVASRLPQTVEQADLVSYGIFRAHRRDRKVRSVPGIQVRDLRNRARQRRDHRRAPVLRLGAAVGSREGMVGDPPADRLHDPVEAFEVDEMKVILADAVNHVPERERLVLTLYYYEGLTLSEIGDVLGVTESRACQIHTKAILQLRARLGEPEEGRVR